MKFSLGGVKVSPLQLCVMCLALTSRAMAESFPASGTYHAQSSFIDTLPATCPKDVSAQLRSIYNAQDSFAALKESGAQGHVYKHSFWENDGIATVRKIATGEGAKDSHEVIIGSEGDAGPVRHHFETTPSGDLKPVRKEQLPVDEYKRAIDKGKSGVVVKIDDPDEEGRSCFRHGLK